MMLKIFVMYFAIGMLMTIQITWDDIVRFIEEDNLPISTVVIIAIGASFVMPISVIYGFIMGIIGIFKRH